MSVYRFPILVWQDHQGGHTAALAGDDDRAAAFGGTAAEAVAQLRELLEWQYRHDGWRPEPEVVDPRLVTVKVEVRPEYCVEREDESRPPYAGKRERTYACAEGITLRVACVCGRDDNGLLVCVMPLLGSRFTYYDPDAFHGLVTHSVQSMLNGLTPAQIARLLPPKAVTLDEVVVRVAHEDFRRRYEPPLPALSAVAEPLGVRGARRQLSRPWERDAEVARLVGVLTKEKGSVVLVGDGGSGKTAVLAEAVRKVEQGKFAGTDLGKEAATTEARHRFWQTTAARLIAGMQYLGQWQERCEEVIEELEEVGGVLCAENLLDLVRVGGVGAGDSLAAFLVPYLQRGDLRLVAEATAAELDACRRLLPAMADVFQVLTLPPFTRPQAVAALRAVADTHGRNLHVQAEAGVVEQVYRLFARFMPYRPFPGPAVAFVGGLFSSPPYSGEGLSPLPCNQGRGRVGGLAQGPRAVEGPDRPRDAPHPALSPEYGGVEKERVTSTDVIARFVRQSGLPELFVRDEMPLARDAVLAALREQVVGQEAACAAAADVVMTFKAGLNDPNRPLGVLLFCGPTGVGKTELAKALSAYLFGHGAAKDRLIRLDMSEYAGPGAAERLLGSDAAGGPRGEPSPLVRRVRQQPFAVLLLDEIEKAAPEVFDVLLGVFDEGRLTDPYGRLTTFRSTVIIMTSNLGADRPDGFGLRRTGPPAYDDAAMDFFRPEFFNRIDAVVTFDPLSPETVERITRKELREIAKREGLTRANLRLAWTDRLVRHLAAKGFDRRYGARPLQRTLEALVVAPLSKYLIGRPGLCGAAVSLDVDEAGGVSIGGPP